MSKALQCWPPASAEDFAHTCCHCRHARQPVHPLADSELICRKATRLFERFATVAELEVLDPWRLDHEPVAATFALEAYNGDLDGRPIGFVLGVTTAMKCRKFALRHVADPAPA